MLAAAAIQIGTNLWNDAADAARGTDQPDRLGPPRMTALGLMDGAEVRRGALAAFGVAALAGLYLAGIGGWPIVAIGLVSLALGYLYSLGPYPLSGLPVGEILVIAFFGVVAVSGMAYLNGADPFDGRALVTGLIIGLPAAAVLMLNNHRDRVQDARAGRHTLALVLGPVASRLSYFAALLAAVGLAALLAPSLWLVPVLGMALWLGHAMWHWPISSRLNALLGQTGLFQGLLFVALVLGA
jgi:1,4-dihydroxy-2-naphthoate octaprenyltransferase